VYQNGRQRRLFLRWLVLSTYPYAYTATAAALYNNSDGGNAHTQPIGALLGGNQSPAQGTRAGTVRRSYVGCGERDGYGRVCSGAGAFAEEGDGDGGEACGGWYRSYYSSVDLESSYWSGGG